jgi:hypothetical protein
VTARGALAWGLAAALLGACTGGTGTQLLGVEGRDRETLEAVYPPGTPRDVVRARKGQALVFSIHACDFGAVERDPALAAALAAFREAFPDTAASCDRVRLARPGWVTLLGGLAYYQDYVFYDEEDQVLVAYRTYIQRSGD